MNYKMLYATIALPFLVTGVAILYSAPRAGWWDLIGVVLCSVAVGVANVAGFGDGIDAGLKMK